MRDEDFDDFARMWLAAQEQYGRQAPQWTDLALAMAFDALTAYPLEDVRRALSAHWQDPDVGQYPPKVADVIRRIDGSGTDRAYAAWNKVIRAAASIGRYRSVAFDDSIIHCVLHDIGGWDVICDTTEDSEPFVRQDFMKRYAAYQRRPPDHWPRYLAGIEERERRAYGQGSEWLTVPEPTLIGDGHAALAVMEGGSEHASVSMQGLSEIVQQQRLGEGDGSQ